ncbi:MAG: ribonuclease E activity regulator RraA [Deltaproteobacteria bacterium]|nr:ribonuclease E activity regulator RraA [Deltaproteobacteria bacterium]MCB9786148.1 ribonuclease E activity regulator RraA [Deltaproteobacteria bacterium]
MNDTSWTTADLYDAFEDEVRVAAPIFRDFGGHRAFSGEVATVKVHEDNVLVRRALESPGRGRVLVVDGGGSLRSALVGDRVAALACDSGWAGLVVWGCIRDSRAIAGLPVGLKALATHPRRSPKHGAGQVDIPVSFADLTFRPGDFVYADEDGLLLAPRSLV